MAIAEEACGRWTLGERPDVRSRRTSLYRPSISLHPAGYRSRGNLLPGSDVQSLLQAETNKIILLILFVSLPGLISLIALFVRRRSDADRRRDDLRLERERRIADEAASRSEATNKLAGALVDQNKHLGSLVEVVSRMQDGAENRQRQLEKQSVELHEQTDTLDALAEAATGINSQIAAHRKDSAPAIEAVKLLPERLDAVKSEIAAVKSGVDGLQPQIKTEIAPALAKLDAIETSVKAIDLDVKRLFNVIESLRSELLATVKASLAPPKIEPASAPSFVAAVEVQAPPAPEGVKP